ncbi:Protein of unknown function, partial [Gryllus bimaculatus]
RVTSIFPHRNSSPSSCTTGAVTIGIFSFRPGAKRTVRITTGCARFRTITRD